jgi:geranylgeranyl reductase family protein
MRDACDVAVVGAGPGGSAAAYYLAKRGLGVLLLDKAEFPRDKTCGDGLTPRAVGVLEDMGLLSNLTRAGREINGVEIYAPDGFAIGAALPRRRGGAAPILVVPRLVLDNIVREHAVRGGARFQSGVLVTGIEQAGAGVVVRGQKCGHALEIRARMAVVATGAAVPLLVRLGLLRRAPRMMLAARAYFEGMRGLGDRIQIRFNHVPLPGYGWVFPLSPAGANIGAGFYPPVRSRKRLPPNPQKVFDGFVGGGTLRALLEGGRRVGPVKGYPLRVDFPGAPASGDGVLLVGEAAGLVNPLTGEGIDYALESAQIAAEYAGRALLSDGNRGDGEHAEYERLLRARFERLFAFCRRLRDATAHALLLNRLARIASHRDDLKMLLVDIVLGTREIPAHLSARTILQKIYSLIR